MTETQRAGQGEDSNEWLTFLRARQHSGMSSSGPEPGVLARGPIGRGGGAGGEAGHALGPGDRPGPVDPAGGILTGHLGPLLARRGPLAAASLSDRAVRLRDSRSGLVWLRVAGHTGGTAAVAFSADGRILAATGRDGHIRV